MKRTLILFALAAVASAAAAGVPAGSDREIAARLQPFGNVCRSGQDCGRGAAAQVQATAASGTRSGKQVYDTFCMACHATGVSDAPKVGDVAAWAPRIAKGMDELMRNTVNGINVMPPKGTCMACSDAELEAVLVYMVEGSQ